MDPVEVDIDYPYYAECVDKVVAYGLDADSLEIKTAASYVKQVNDALKANEMEQTNAG